MVTTHLVQSANKNDSFIDDESDADTLFTQLNMTQIRAACTCTFFGLPSMEHLLDEKLQEIEDLGNLTPDEFAQVALRLEKWIEKFGKSFGKALKGTDALPAAMAPTVAAALNGAVMKQFLDDHANALNDARLKKNLNPYLKDVILDGAADHITVSDALKTVEIETRKGQGRVQLVVHFSHAITAAQIPVPLEEFRTK